VDTISFEKEVSGMPESYRPYPPEFRRRMVESVRGGREPEASAREFEPTAQSIHNRVTGWLQR